MINEVVADQRAADSTATPDVREFVELYNPGASPVDISGWSLIAFNLATGAAGHHRHLTRRQQHSGQRIFRDRSAGRAECEFFADRVRDLAGHQFRCSSCETTNVLVDAIGIETFRGVELANATQEQLDQIAAGQTAGATATGGWWGQDISADTIPPNSRTLPGPISERPRHQSQRLRLWRAANHPRHVEQLAAGGPAHGAGCRPFGGEHELSSQYFASFVLPRVIDPTVAGGINTKAIPASPQGGKAIIAWDETGGGNAAYSRELVSKFELYAYIDTSKYLGGGF